MDKNKETNVTNKFMQENKEKELKQTRFTEKERKKKEAKRQTLGGF